MAKVLSKYSQTKNLAQVDYQSQTDYIDKVAKQQKTPGPDDLYTPYNFQDWKNRNFGLIPSKEFDQYISYLKAWYNSRYTPSTASKNLRNDYINLLKELTIVFEDDEDFKKLKDIDYNDNLALEDAIPVFVKKIREISIYLVNKRDAIKKTKLKYNMAGATQALEKIFYEYLLKAFTKRNYVLNVPEQSAYNSFPDLSAISNGFNIQIQELYDDTNYFDKDPSMPISAYFDTNNSSLTSYFDSIDFEGDLNWLFSTGINSVCADNPLIWTLSNITQSMSAYDLNGKLNDYHRIDLTKKYLGNDLYYVTGGYYIPKTKQFVYDLNAGNNWFYWPQGEYFGEITTENYDAIQLSATNLVNIGTGSEKYQTSDRIFIQDNIGGVSGAWLKTKIEDTINQTMTAIIPRGNDPFIFKMPFPGFGISGEGLDWTGKQLSNIDMTFNYLEEDMKKEIQNKYWTDTSTISTIKPISIHDTTLINKGSIAAQNYNDADKLFVRITNSLDKIHDENNNGIYQDSYNRAWLYKMLKTEIPIKVGQNYIYWPVLKYEAGSTLPISVTSTQCTEIPLSTIDVSNGVIIGARAGYGLYDSDIIYKLDSSDGYPIECAFLSGQNLSKLGTTLVSSATGKIQTDLTARCRPGNYEPFIWCDSNVLINNTTITHKEHQKDCQYVNEEHESIFGARFKTLEELNRQETGLSNWQKCNCKSILYSPVGHPGQIYNDYDRMADIIFVDTQYPNTFDITTWRGTDDLPYNQSSDFAWYQITDTYLEPDVGWGRGNWKTGSGTLNFTLSTGILYKYLRANLRRNPGDLLSNAVPPLYIKQVYNNISKPVWRKANLDNDGTWVKTDNATDMIIKPGDFLVYDHMDSYWYCLTSIGTYGTTIADPITSVNIAYNNDGFSRWSNFTYVTTGVTIALAWPDLHFSGGPSKVVPQVTSVNWSISCNNTKLYSATIPSENNYYFIPDSVGVYRISATGYASDGNVVINANTIIPNITTVSLLGPQVSGELAINTIYNDRVNTLFVLPLTGWNYTTKQYDGVSHGGRPIWSKAYDDDSEYTKNKRIDVNGNIINNNFDDYTLTTQPNIADIVLNTNDYVEYYHKGTGINWIQPITVYVNNEIKSWKYLDIKRSINSPLSSYLYNISSELVISATDIDSDLVLSKTNNLIVNYWAVNAFTWSQELTDSSLGLPPTGGIWIEPVSGLLVEALVPYANLTNRHYPTIASVPYVPNLYSTEDYGGYNVPRTLGASIYIGQDYKNKLVTQNKSGLSATFNDPQYYNEDTGLTNTTQYKPLSTYSIDSSWIKASIVEGNKAGDVVNANKYQELIPYQTKYETILRNQNGLRFQSDSYDPWSGTQDNTWTDGIKYPVNFRGDFDIYYWYDKQIIPSDKFIYQWKTDIFGTQYALLKTQSNSIYQNKLNFGEIWIRDQNDNIKQGSIGLSALYNDISIINPSISSELYYNLRDFDIWFDTIMLYTSGHVFFSKIDFDYDTGQISTNSDDVRSITLSANYGGKFGGIWFFDEDKKVTVCVLGSSTNIVFPKFYTYNLDTSDLIYQYSGEGTTIVNQLSTLMLTSIEEPVFTYNNIKKDYNISFIGSSNNYNVVLNTMYVKNLENTNEITSIISVTPVSYN